MRKPEAIEALINLIEHSSPDKRREALGGWMSRYVAHIHEAQLIVAPKQLSIDNHDFICHKITHDCLDSMLEKDLVRFTVRDHEYIAEMWALRSFKHIKDFKK